MTNFLSTSSGVVVLALGCAGALIVLLLHTRLQSEIEGLLVRQRSASAELRRVQIDAAVIRGEAEKVASKLNLTRDFLGKELTKALEPPKPARKPARRPE